MGQRRVNVLLVEIVGGRHPDGIDIWVGQEILIGAINAWAAVSRREPSECSGADPAAPTRRCPARLSAGAKIVSAKPVAPINPHRRLTGCSITVTPGALRGRHHFRMRAM